MKKIFLFLALTIICNSSFSQTFEAQPDNFVWAPDSIPKPFISDSFAVHNFILGFQWSGSPRMDKALSHNAKAGGLFKLDAQEIPDNDIIHIIAQPTKDAHNGEFTSFDNTVMMQYEPTLPLFELI